MLKINLSIKNSYIPIDTIGIDMGQSLTKIAYLDENSLNLLSISTQKGIPEIKKFIESKKTSDSNFNFTGGRCFKLFKEYSNEIQVNIFNEFEAIIKGIEYLYLLEKNKKLLSSLVVTMGTGISIVLQREIFKHLGGSSMGGGFFMGIIKLLFDLNNFSEAISLAKKGNRYNVDLKVSDIYDSEDIRVDNLFREFTAASLGKIEYNFDKNTINTEDFLNSLICAIGENIGTIATLMAETYNIIKIVFSGGFLKGNRPLKRILSLLCNVKRKKAIFLKNSEFSAAIGAMLL